MGRTGTPATRRPDRPGRRILDDELAELRQQEAEGWAERRYEQARDLFEGVALADEFADFLTLPAYEVVD